MKARHCQVLVVAAMALYSLWFFSYSIWPFSDEMLELASYNGAGAFLDLTKPAIYVPLFALRVMATVGLLLFYTWGRTLFALWLLVDVALTPFAGIAVYSFVDNSIGYVSTLMDGMIVALAFFGPLSHLFRIDGQAQQGAPGDGPRPEGSARP